MILWLHGGGEGGSDPLFAYTSNQVVNLIKDNIQAYYDGAYELVPQCPTSWMDDGGRSLVIPARPSMGRM